MADWLIKIFDTAQWSHQCWQWALLEVLPLLERRRQVILAHVYFCNISQLSWGKSNPDTDICWIIWRAAANHYWCLVALNAYEWWFYFRWKRLREVFAHRLTLTMIEKQWLMWKRRRATWHSSDMLCIVKHTSVLWCALVFLYRPTCPPLRF